MHTAIRLATTSLVVAVLLQALPAKEIMAEPSPVRPEITNIFTFRTRADAALTDWALSRFHQAGLELPPLNLAFHDSKQPCDGNVGLYRSGDTPLVDICGFNWDRFLITPKKTLLHELAHAWAGANLSEETKERFVQFRGLTTWGDDQIPWAEQGSEQAAEIIAWALLDQELVMASIEDTDPRTLAQAYELLTSTEPPSWGRVPITMFGTVTPEDQGLVDWAVSRFREAELELPTVEIVFDPSGGACEGASGRFTEKEEEMRVVFCTGQEGLTLTNRVAILHELGHAWLASSVSTEAQTTFLHLRGLESWNDQDQPWHKRGFEHAAEMIAWALMDQEVWMYRIQPNDFDSLRTSYQVLTGRQPTQRLQEQAAPSRRHRVHAKYPNHKRRGALLKNSPSDRL